jgi:hypothetical protein
MFIVEEIKKMKLTKYYDEPYNTSIGNIKKDIYQTDKLINSLYNITLDNLRIETR